MLYIMYDVFILYLVLKMSIFSVFISFFLEGVVKTFGGGGGGGGVKT